MNTYKLTSLQRYKVTRLQSYNTTRLQIYKEKSLKINKTNFIPVDSEHFSIWYGLNKKFKTTNVKRIYLTASGGPLLNISNKKLKV